MFLSTFGCADKEYRPLKLQSSTYGPNDLRLMALVPRVLGPIVMVKFHLPLHGEIGEFDEGTRI